MKGTVTEGLEVQMAARMNCVVQPWCDRGGQQILLWVRKPVITNYLRFGEDF
ncbi:hypothetical protein ABIE13_001962 [Ottowia thiooxydans]|uniref:Uncharacterized protein n=1 Tax=Ottowia thiooxydans TaxID=219182 RepID=A0ABV2Q8E1_9BURK